MCSWKFIAQGLRLRGSEFGGVGLDVFGLPLRSRVEVSEFTDHNLWLGVYPRTSPSKCKVFKAEKWKRQPAVDSGRESSSEALARLGVFRLVHLRVGGSW